MDLTVAFPCRDGGPQALRTVEAFVSSATDPSRLRFSIVDDGSENSPIDPEALAQLSRRLNVPITFNRIAWGGVAKARNAAVRAVDSGAILMTDCHVRPTDGFDVAIRNCLDDDVVLALTIGDETSGFRAFGCRLVVPFMGTHWIRDSPGHLGRVDVASSAGSVFTREAYDKIGGYDEGMHLYGAIEPEFSTRAWMKGLEVLSLPSVAILHEFKSKDDVHGFVSKNRTAMVHNSLRFGMIYLDESRVLQLLRFYALQFPEAIDEALAMLDTSEVWARREQLFNSFVRTFEQFSFERRIRDHSGAPLWEPIAAEATA